MFNGSELFRLYKNDEKEIISIWIKINEKKKLKSWSQFIARDTYTQTE